MARGRGGRGGGGVGGFLMSALIFLIIGGIIFAVAKANNINDAGALIKWSRQTSDQFRGCVQPEIKFWKCAFSGGKELENQDGTKGEAPKDDKTPGSDGSGSDSGGSNGSTGGNSSSGGSEPSKEPSQSNELKKLAALKVGDPQSVDYDRGEWKHWIGDRCNDTRQQVLREQAKSFKLDAEGCRVASGEWVDPYTGKTFTDPSKLDIDHVYALGAAAKNGGNGWSAAKKQQYANDKSQLLAVSASANRSKSDKNPAEWWPENDAYSCQMATKYVDVATKYGLQFSKADVKVLEKGLKTCG